MNPIIPLGAVALALAGFMFWKKGNETAPRTFPRTPVVPPIDYDDEGGDWFTDNYVPPAPVIIPPIDYGDEGGDWFTDTMEMRPPVQGAIDPHIGKPGYLGNGMWDLFDRGTGASEQSFWSGYDEG
jgi:hypothetical protein